MSYRVDKEILDRALEIYGPEHQMHHAQEECAELIVAISQYNRGRITEKDVASEIADVIIMADQLTNIIGVDIVEEQIKYKMDRLKSRLEA